MNYKLLILGKRDNRDQNLRIVLLQRKPQFFFSHIFVCKMEPPFAEKFRSICMKLKRRFLASQQTDALQIGLITVSDAILTGRQSGQKLQCLYGNPMAKNFFQNRILRNL